MPLGWQNPDLSVTLGCEAHQHRRFGVSGAHSAQPPHSPPTPQPPWQLAGDSIFPAPRDPVRQVISSWQDQGSVGQGNHLTRLNYPHLTIKALLRASTQPACLMRRERLCFPLVQTAASVDRRRGEF